MTTKQNDAALTDEQLKWVAGGTPHYTSFTGRFQLVSGTMCSARASKQLPAEQNKRPIWKRER